MKTPKKICRVIVGCGMVALAPILYANDLPQKTVAIHYEEGKTSQALFYKSFEYFQKLIESGELKLAILGTANIFGEVIDIQTQTDNILT